VMDAALTRALLEISTNSTTSKHGIDQRGNKVGLFMCLCAKRENNGRKHQMLTKWFRCSGLLTLFDLPISCQTKV
jgi:hypothetical protein